MSLAATTTVVLVAFAANSIFARLALGSGESDALGYTGVRLLSGAIVLFVLMAWRQRRLSLALARSGSWTGTIGLGGYALLFSLAYVILETGTGAVVLFASVQFGLLGWAVAAGDRPGLLEWAGIAIAFAALVVLVSPGIAAPAPLGVLLMVGAGLSWCLFTVEGRRSHAPLSDTAGNFIRLVPIACALILVAWVIQPPQPMGVVWAVASGALASGLGYALWYLVLPRLAPSTPAFVQLTVPAIAAAGGVVFLGEQVTVRLVVASLGILGGVGLTLWASNRRRP